MAKGSSKSGGSKPAPTVTRYREADKGRYVTKEYAEKHKGTTVKETDKK